MTVLKAMREFAVDVQTIIRRRKIFYLAMSAVGPAPLYNFVQLTLG